jgi:hypothetical protein
MSYYWSTDANIRKRAGELHAALKKGLLRTATDNYELVVRDVEETEPFYYIYIEKGLGIVRHEHYQKVLKFEPMADILVERKDFADDFHFNIRIILYKVLTPPWFLNTTLAWYIFMSFLLYTLYIFGFHQGLVSAVDEGIDRSLPYIKQTLEWTKEKLEL